MLLHVVEAFCGGVLNSVSSLCHMVCEDFRLVVLHSTRDETPAGFERFFPAGTAFQPWSARRALHPLQDFRALMELRRHLGELRPCVVHAHSSKAGALARVAGAAHRVPVLYSPRGYAFLQLDRSRPMRQVYRIAEWALGKLPHVTVGCGADEYGLARGMRVSESVLVPNAVDVEDLAAYRQPKRDDGAPCVVAQLGRAAPQKDSQSFVELARRWEGNARVRLRWIGGRPEDLVGPCPSNLELTGWLPPDEARRLLGEADVLVHLSRWEGLSLAILEALSMSIPVVATAAPGNVELVTSGWNGFLVDSPAKAGPAVETLISDRNLRVAMGERGHSLVAGCHDLRLARSRWRALYARMSAKGRAVGPAISNN